MEEITGSSPAPEARRTLGGRRTRMRMLNTPGDGIVAVYEQDPIPGEQGERVLVFETLHARRVVSSFPDDWHTMSVEQLTQMATPKPGE